MKKIALVVFFSLSFASPCAKKMLRFLTFSEFEVSFVTHQLDLAIKVENENKDYSLETIDRLRAEVRYYFNLLDHLSAVKNSKAVDEAYAKYNVLAFAPASEEVFEAIRATKAEGERAHLKRKLLQKMLDNGTGLKGHERARFVAIKEKLEELKLHYFNSVKSDFKKYAFRTINKDDLKGLNPDEFFHDSAYVIDATEANLTKVLTYAENESLRRYAYEQFTKVGHANMDVALEILKLRQEMAKLLGHQHFAEFIVSNNMAGNLDRALSLVKTYGEAYQKGAERDLQELDEFMGFKVHPWDVKFYGEKLKAHKYGSIDVKIKLEDALNALFTTVQKYFDLSFVERFDLPKWDPSVRVFEVLNKDGSHRGFYYMDLFARSHEKNPNAWNSSIRQSDRRHSPLVVNAANIPKDQLSVANMVTLFHEMGHALHDLTSDSNYVTVAGTNVEFDSVEIPSKFMEHFVYEPEVAALYAPSLTSDDLSRLNQMQHFQASLTAMHRARLGLIDLLSHSEDLTALKTGQDLANWENEQLKSYTAGIYVPPIFGYCLHVFKYDYHAQMYTYRWSEAIAAALYDQFDAKSAKRFLKEFLKKGAQRPIQESIDRFLRGKKLDEKALLRNQGLVN